MNDSDEAVNLLEMAWGLIANAGWDAHRNIAPGGSSPGWNEAALLWRDSYFEYEDRRINGRHEEPR